MVEKILEQVVNEMIPYLDDGQLDHLKMFYMSIFTTKSYATNAQIWFPGVRAETRRKSGCLLLVKRP